MANVRSDEIERLVQERVEAELLAVARVIEIAASRIAEDIEREFFECAKTLRRRAGAENAGVSDHFID
jgi:hypothetical protein